ncbi:NAD-P-binding protein [Meredithblackwellia eburnea MCA 4105]
MTSQLLLITGVSGYVGAACLVEAISQGYKVRGAVRKQEQADRWYEAHPEFGKDKLEFAIIGDITKRGAWDDAIKGVNGVVHVASPVKPAGTDFRKDLLDPAIDGTLRILEAAAKEKSVKSVVITSSGVAFMDPFNLKKDGEAYTSQDYNPLTYEEAAAPDVPYFGRYAAAKALAEKAAWSFVREEKPGFTLSTILPGWCMGPSEQPGLTSSKDLPPTCIDSWFLLVDNKLAMTTPPPPFMHFVDVRNVAQAHITAITRAPAASGKRFPLIGGRWSYRRVGELLAEHFPEEKERIKIDGEEGLPDAHVFADSAMAEDILGIKYSTLSDTIRDLGAQAFKLKADDLSFLMG